MAFTSNLYLIDFDQIVKYAILSINFKTFHGITIIFKMFP